MREGSRQAAARRSRQRLVDPVLKAFGLTTAADPGDHVVEAGEIFDQGDEAEGLNGNGDVGHCQMVAHDEGAAVEPGIENTVDLPPALLIGGDRLQVCLFSSGVRT